MKKAIITLCCIALSPLVYAGGYRVSLQGQKALGMGHTGVAVSGSAESTFFNPGALTELDGNYNISGGFTGIYSKNRYQNEDTGATASTDNAFATPVNFYIAGKYSDNIALGFGLYTPYGSGVEWDRDWAGSHLVNDIDLRSIFLQPTIAYKINDTTSIGFGPIAAISSIELNRNLSTSLQDANGRRSNVTLEDSGIIDYGYNIGVFFQASDRLDLGLNYRSEITVKSEGDADFSNIPDALSDRFADGNYESELPLPAELTLGVAYQYTDKLLLAFDYNYTFWDAYEELTIEFENPNTDTNVNPRNYQNSSIYRIGMEYQQSDKLALRSGLYYDESPIQDGFFAPETPRADSLGITAGLSYRIKSNLELDVAGFYLYFNEEDNSYDFSSEGVFEGEYKVTTWGVGLGLSYTF